MNYKNPGSFNTIQLLANNADSSATQDLEVEFRRPPPEGGMAWYVIVILVCVVVLAILLVITLVRKYRKGRADR